MYPVKPSGDNAISEDYIFALNDADKEPMSSTEILGGYTNKGEAPSPLSSIPDANKFNSLMYQMHNSLVWVIKYIEELFASKLEKSGGTMTGTLAMGSNKVTTSYAPTDSVDLTNKLYVDNATSGAMWLGETKMLSYPSIPTLPAGMEVVNADGRALSRTTYSSLFSLIGVTYGSGDGSNTFNIPDLRGVAVRGWDSGRGLDSGRLFGSYQDSGAPNITGSFYDALTGISPSFSGAFSGTRIGANDYNDGAFNRYSVSFNASTSSSQYQSINEVRMKNIALYPVIRIK